MARTKRLKDFINWCKQPPADTNQQSISLENIQNRNSHDAIIQAFKQINNEINNKTHLNVSINTNLHNDKYELHCKNKSTCTINSFIVSAGTGNFHLTLSNLRINRLVIRANPGQHAHINFSNCDIKHVAFYHDCHATLKDTNIGTMELDNINNLQTNGGSIFNFECPVPGNQNPLSGSIIFKNTYFPRNTKNKLLTGAQPYRNMRHHLMSIENGQMANLFHTLELAVEREDDSNFNKIVSYTYEYLSDFGSSALRPILWWVLIGLIGSMVLLYTTPPVPAFDSSSTYYTGWRSSLIASNDPLNEAHRSIYMSYQSMLNPLGILGLKTLLVPAKGWQTFYLLFQGLLSAILIALTIFAIRRRFKINS